MELVDRVARKRNLSLEQAAGCVGAVLWLAQSRLERGALEQLADAIPGFSDLVGKSPRYDPRRKTIYGWLSRLIGGSGGLRLLHEPLAKLGLPRSEAAHTAVIVIKYVRQHGGPETEVILRRALT